VAQQMNNTILFVDDEVRILTALQRSLYRGYRIEIAGSAKDALEAMGEGAYAVVVSDLRMPGMDGIEFLRRVKRNISRDRQSSADGMRRC